MPNERWAPAIRTGNLSLTYRSVVWKSSCVVRRPGITTGGMRTCCPGSKSTRMPWRGWHSSFRTDTHKLRNGTEGRCEDYGKYGYDSLTHAKSVLISPPDVAIDHLFPPYTKEKVRALDQWFDY